MPPANKTCYLLPASQQQKHLWLSLTYGQEWSTSCKEARFLRQW